jgi:O-antigen ligase
MLAAYVLLNATWSADPTTGLRKAAIYASLVLMSYAAVQALAILDRQTVRCSGLFFAAGVFVGALFILAEMLTHGFVTRFAMNRIPLLYPFSPKHFEIAKQGFGLDVDQLSYNVGVMMFNLWPALLALSSLKRPIRTAAMAVLFVTIAVVVMISAHAASQVALLGSGIIVMAMWRWPRYGVRALAVLWCLSFVLVIPASFAAYQNGLHLAPWLPGTARQRIIIWQYTAEQVFSRPLLGAGIESTPVLNRQQKSTDIEQPDGFVYPRVLGSHAHDIYLQAWFELGAVGALLLAVAGAAVIVRITSLPVFAQPFAGGTLAAFAIVAAFSWSLWQVWFMCAAALLPLYLRVSAATAEQ